MKISDIFKGLAQRAKSGFNRDFLTYLVFLLIAITIWYLNALSKDYTTDLKFAVRYSDLPDDKVLTNAPPDQLNLTLNAQGFTLLKYRFGLLFNPLVLEASYHTLRRKSDSRQGEYFLSTQSLFERIASQLGSDVRLRMVEPDTLDFLLSETIRKNIPVKSALQMQFEKGFFPRGGMVIEPKEITVIGPKTVVDTMQYVHTRPRAFKKVKSSVRATIGLQPVHQLRYSVGEVQIVQVVERFTQASVAIPIEPVNLPEGMMLKTFPASVTINCMAPISDYEKLQPFMFRAVVDYNAIMDERDNQSKARVQISRAPDFVIDVMHHPMNVDFIIEK